MEDKDSKQEGEGLGNGSKQRESEFTPPKSKEEEDEAQSDDVDQVMRDRSGDQTADDGDAAAPTEPLEEAAKCNSNGSGDQTAIAVVSEPTTAEESNGNNNINNGEAKGGVTAEQLPKNAHHRNQPANADVDVDADAVKVSTAKPHPNKNAAVDMNGFDDIEMVEAEGAGSPEDGTPA